MSVGSVTLDLLRPASAGKTLTVGLIHGLGSSNSVWERCAHLLPANVEATAFGFPWDARDGSAWAWEPEPWVWLDRALQGAPRWPDVFVAHSFGACVLLDYLHRHGIGTLRGLVLLSPFYRAKPELFDWAALTHYVNDFDDLIRTGILLRRGAPPEPELLEGMIERVRERIGPYGWLRFFDLFTRMPMVDLTALTLPCLVIAGGRDTAAYPADCRSLAQALPNATFEILPDSGHFTMVDDPSTVATLISPFLEGLGT